MKKLTLVLVALLLALACVFAACGKKNDTPTDTDPKPVDNDPAVVEPTVAKEDLVKIAEGLKNAYLENYADLYSPAVVNTIDAEKSSALLKINSASSKEEAQKVADDFIAFLKAQKTTVDELKDLIAKIGDVALADEDAVNEATAYKGALDAAFAGANAAKKAVLDAYKADEETQKTIEKMTARLAQLKKAKKDADAEAGINAKLATMLESFNEEDKTFSLADFDTYSLKMKAVAAFAKDFELVEGTEAYAEIIDTKTIAAAKAILDDVTAKDKVLVAMMEVVEAADALDTAADAARYKTYCWIYNGKADDEKETAVKTKVGEQLTKDDAIKEAKAECAEQGIKFDEAKIVEVESAESEAQGKWSKDCKAVLKLALKADVEAAVAVKNALFKFYNATELKTRYGYGVETEPVKVAVDKIDAIAAAYKASVGAANTSYPALFEKTYVDVNPASEKNYKGNTIGSYVVEGTFNKQTVSTNQKTLKEAIGNALASFKTLNAAGKPIAPAGDELKLNTKGAYTADGTNYYDLVDGKPVIYFTAWTYTYKLGDAALAVTAEFVPETVLTKDTLKEAQDALLWLEKYIGEDLADSYDFTGYKDYGFTKVKLTLADRDVTEVANAGVVQINGAAVEVAKSEAVAAKVLNPLTVAKALIAEQEKIEAAQKAAVEELQAAVLAIFKEGDANAIDAARALYKGIADGSYLNKKLYEKDEAKEYLAVDLKDLTVEVKPESKKGAGDAVKKVIDNDPDPENKKGDGILVRAENVLKAAKDTASANTKVELIINEVKVKKALADWAKAVDDAKGLVDTNDEYIEAFEAYVARAKEILDAAKIAVEARLVAEKDDSYNTTAKDAQAQYNNAIQLSGIFSDRDTFVSNYADSESTYLGAKDEAAIKAFIKAFEPADIDAKFNADAMAAYIFAITDDTDGEQLAAAVEAAKKNLADALAAFDKLEGLTAKGAYDDRSKIDDVLTAIENLLNFTKKDPEDKTEKVAFDYINLKVAETYGEKTVAFDLLTDTYVGKLLSKAYAPIGKILADAKKVEAEGTGLVAADVSEAIAGDAWENSVTNLVEAEDVAIGTVASIKDAAKALNDYKLVNENYKLQSCLDLVNAALKKAEKKEIDLAALKAVAGIE